MWGLSTWIELNSDLTIFFSELETQLEELQTSLNETVSTLIKGSQDRKDIEDITDTCQHWFKEADFNLASGDVRTSTTAEILVEHIIVVNINLFINYYFQCPINPNFKFNSDNVWWEYSFEFQ